MGSSKNKPDGWWSRRHRTREAQEEARERWRQNHGPEARIRKAKERAEEREAKKKTEIAGT